MARSAIDRLRKRVCELAAVEGDAPLARRLGIGLGALRSMKDGRAPLSTTVEAIVAALDLEFYIGPQRETPDSSPWWEPHGDLLGPTCPVILARRIRAALIGRSDDSTGPGCPHPALCTNGCERMEGAKRSKYSETGHGVFCTPWPLPEGATATRLSPHGCAWFGAGMIAELDLDPDQCSAVEIADDAMAPTLPARSVALIDLRRVARREGAVYAVDTGENVVMRRLKQDGSRWLAIADGSGREPLSLESGAGTILGEAIWRVKLVPDGSPTASRAGPSRMVAVDADDAGPVAVPWRGALEPDQPRDFWMQVAAWFGAAWLVEKQIEPLQAEVAVPIDDAMTPSLWPNSAVLIDRRRTALRDGATYELATAEGLAFRRVTKDGNQWMVSGDDPRIVPRPWAKTDDVVGQAIWTAGFMPHRGGG